MDIGITFAFWVNKLDIEEENEMFIRKGLTQSFKLSSAFILVTLLAIGCTSVNYVGESFDPTTDVDVYYSKEDIKKEYTVMGHATGLGTLASNDKIQKTLIEEARRKGADAVLITGLGKTLSSAIDDSGIDENHIYASFLKYKF